MLDKVRLSTNDFTLESDLRDKEKWGYISNTGNITSYFCNYRAVNITIYPDDRLILQFNPYADSLGVGSYDPEVLKTREKIVKNVLKEQGVSVNFDSCNLSRLDFCRDVSLKNSVNLYQEIIKGLPYSKMSLVSYYSGFIQKNSQHQLCMYDKVKEAESEKIITPEQAYNWKNINLLRAETRFLTKKKINSYTGMETYGDLREQPEICRQTYQKYMNKEVFKAGKGLNIQVDSNILTRIVQALKVNGRVSEGAIASAIVGSDFREVFQALGGVEYCVNEIAEQLNYTRIQKHRLRKKLQKYYSLSMFQENSREQPNKYDMYNELQNKLLTFTEGA